MRALPSSCLSHADYFQVDRISEALHALDEVRMICRSALLPHES